MHLLLLLLAVGPVAPTELDEINANLAYIEANLPLVGRYIGKPPTDLPPLLVATGTGAIENYALASNLLHQVHQLRLDLTRTQAPELESSMMISQATFHVEWDAVDEAVKLAGEDLRAIVAEWRLPHAPAIALPVIKPDALFARLSHLVRSTNRLLNSPHAPPRVYRTLTRALGYSSTLLSALGAADPTPVLPPFVANQQPVDVFRALLATYAFLETHRLPGTARFAHLQAVVDYHGEIDSGDVDQLAILLQVDLAWLHGQVPDANPPPPDFYPGVKFPSHVLQRAAALQVQLRRLLPLLDRQVGPRGKP